MAAPMGSGTCTKFNLFDLHQQDLKKLLEFVENEKVCVISVIGKSSLSSPSFKTSIIGEAVDRNLYQRDEVKEKEASESKASVTGYLDSKNKLIFLNLYEITDTNYIINLCNDMEEELKTKSLLEIWADFQYQYAKILLLLFNLSHIVIIVHPNSSFDMSYVYLFQVLNDIRFRSRSWFSEQLKNFDISSDWVQAGRPCSSRVLFVFESCPQHLLTEQSTDPETQVKKAEQLKELAHSLEDQIYRILRKSRVITNVSSNSLFAIPANQEFVYVFSSKPYISDPAHFFMSQILLHCQLAKENDSSSTKLNSSHSSIPSSNIGNGHLADDLGNGYDCGTKDFASFLQQHTKLALTKGFDDNMGRHPVPASFELPYVHTWFELASKLSQSLLCDTKERNFLSALKTALDVDVRFSDWRCRKVLPLASAAYQENLTIHYTEKFHKNKLAQALQVFSMHARGPACRRYAQQLTEDCYRFWKNGHQMCEVLSLTGNHCINIKHRTEDDPEDKALQVMAHCSQVKLISACNCGRKQASREDPFSVKAANYDFYMTFNHCCGELEKIKFPIFQASTSESHPAHISPAHVPKVTALSDPEPTEKLRDEDPVETSEICSNLTKVELSGGNSEGSLLAQEEEDPIATGDNHTQSPTEEGRDEIIISIQESDETTTHKEKVLTRQPSTTEYLPGMLHSNSPLGLLPLFSSWSLVCVGPSSLYSHNIGLQDQPGFIQGTNFLLPWDVTVKVEHKERWPALWEGKRPIGIKGKKPPRDSPQFNVKIFIGIEYECFRGHRFMCSSPDRVLRATNSGLVKDNALKITGSDMPLYFPCPCRPTKPLIAQLMRIHVVTPKAPVHVTLNPQVQPAPEPCPIFFPTINEPLKLSQSSYWVLRFPFAYVSDQTVYYPPREPVPAEFCRLLKGTYNIAEHQSIR